MLTKAYAAQSSSTPIGLTTSSDVIPLVTGKSDPIRRWASGVRAASYSPPGGRPRLRRAISRRRSTGKLGLFGIAVREAYGGAGLDVSAYALVTEELSRDYASVVDQCGLRALVGTLLSGHGTGAPRALHGAAAACTVAARLLHNGSGCGIDVSGIRMTATRSATRGELSGAKLWIHNRELAAQGHLIEIHDLLSSHNATDAVPGQRQTDGTRAQYLSLIYPTAAVTWGEPGTNGQHAFFQMLHQGPTIVPIDFIAVLTPEHSLVSHHPRLLANSGPNHRCRWTRGVCTPRCVRAIPPRRSTASDGDSPKMQAQAAAASWWYRSRRSTSSLDPRMTGIR
ncbi:Acyl-CoA dehydrogenase, N-terminal domain [Burkholderia sp. YR290]|nr:Acyl-CoA dehydrogenase, N-terminal domain [Burkholderia sp. YR290]